jgi:hypothetical protein
MTIGHPVVARSAYLFRRLVGKSAEMVARIPQGMGVLLFARTALILPTE